MDNPIAFSVGFVSVSWYAILFLLGVLGTAWIFRRIVARLAPEQFSDGEIFDAILFLFFGAVLGARIGYVLLYFPSYYRVHPLSVLSPFDPITSEWVGIAGMSYHGGATGIALALFLFSLKYKKPFWIMADALACAIPVASFFGRIGNFLAGELPGRLANHLWVKLSPLQYGTVRYPTPLFEALVEGVILFGIMFFLSQKHRTPGILASWYLVLYGVFRFVLEFVREPDPQIGFFFGWMTMGQILSIGMVVVGVVISFGIRRGIHISYAMHDNIPGKNGSI